MRIARTVVIDCHVEDVFDFVADSLNDPKWCEKVLDVRQTAGEGPGPGARYEVVHRPVPWRPTRRMAYACVAWEPPHRVAWHEDDGTDVIDVSYELRSVWTATRLTQIDDARLGATAVVRPLIKIGLGRDMARQLQALKRVLECRR